DILIDIWYKSSLQAHDFIYSGYWESQIEEMKEKYIPMSETHVITNQTKIIGFISMVEGYLAALFIDVAYQNNGDRKSTRLNSSHVSISYAVFCLKKKKNTRL